jgi:peptidoglycan/LPS O-acetylase OafA/YrhL
VMTVATSSPNGGPELRGQIPDYGKRMPGLDVVRGIAIVAVLFYHGVATDWMIAGAALPAWQRAFLDHFRYGGFGVHLFYVLSGFLIAGILLDTRADSNYYKNFYLRRLLRIVPAYLLMIVVLKVFGAISWAYLAACLLFICNMPRLLHASKEYGPFWSLSVEEQFYLTWPFIIRKLSVQNVFRLCVGIILFAPLLRYGVQFLPAALSDIRYKTWDVADFFAAGTLLAISVRSPRILRSRLCKAVVVLLGAGGVLAVSVASLSPLASGPWIKFARAVELCPYVILFAGVVLLGFLVPGMASTSIGGILSFLGDISYGLYLCHEFLFVSINRWLPIHDNGVFSMFTQIWLRFLLKAAVSIGIAFLSRRYFENIFLKMKPKRSVPEKPVGKAPKQNLMNGIE